EECVCRKATPEEMYELSKDRKHVLSKPDEVAKPNFKGQIMPPMPGAGYVEGPEPFQRAQAAHYSSRSPAYGLDGYPVFHNPLKAGPLLPPAPQGPPGSPESVNTSLGSLIPDHPLDNSDKLENHHTNPSLGSLNLPQLLEKLSRTSKLLKAAFNLSQDNLKPIFKTAAMVSHEIIISRVKAPFTGLPTIPL
ncbi:MAG: hypothetical protein Q9174_005211, partial [Haloplaca sp. 1 TL-2023]